MSTPPEPANASGVGDKRKSRRVTWIVVTSVLLAFVLAQGVLYYFANPLLNGLIRRVVHQQTQGLYELRFSDLKIDMSRRSIELTGVRLIPDEQVYQQLLAEGQVQSSLYNIVVPRLRLNGVDSYSLAQHRSLNIQEIILTRPIVKLIAAPGKKKKKISYLRLQEDIYPTMARFIQAIEIGRIHLNKGYFNLRNNHQKQASKTSVAQINIELEHFFLNGQNYLKRDRLFYSDHFRIELSDYKLSLADSIHKLAASEVILNTKTNSLAAREIRLQPIQQSRQALAQLNKNLLDVAVPRIQVQGIDWPRSFFERTINVHTALLLHPRMAVYKQQQKRQATRQLVREGVKLDLHSLVAGTLETIRLDSFSLEQAQLKLYPNLLADEPLVQMNKFTAMLDEFVLDSASFYNTNKVFYSRHVTLQLQNYQMLMSDSSHRLSARSAFVSTRQQAIRASHVLLQPAEWLQPGHSVYQLALPAMRLHGIDLFRAYHLRDYLIDELVVQQPSVTIEQGAQAKQAGGRFSADELYALTSNYLNRLAIGTTRMQQGQLRMSRKHHNSSQPLQTSGQVSFELEQFSLSPHTLFKQEKLFNARNLYFTVHNYRMDLPGGHEQIRSDTLLVSTRDSLVALSGFYWQPDSLSNDSLLQRMQQQGRSMNMRLQVGKLRMEQADIRAMYFDDKVTMGALALNQADVQMTFYPHLIEQSTQSDTLLAAADTNTMPPPLALDTVWVTFSDTLMPPQAWQVETLFAGPDTLLVIHDTLAGALHVRDSLQAHFAPEVFPDTLLKQNQWIRFDAPLPPFRISADEQLIRTLEYLLDPFLFRRLQLNKVHVANTRLHLETRDSLHQLQLRATQNLHLRLDSFALAPQQLHNDRRLLFAQDFDLGLKQLQVHSPMHDWHFTADSLSLSSRQQAFRGYQIGLSQYPAQAPQRLGGQAIIPQVAITDMDMNAFYRTGILTFDSLRIARPDYRLVLPEASNAAAQPDTKAPTWPTFLHAIEGNRLVLDENAFFLHTRDTATTPQTSLQLHFQWDSVRLRPQSMQQPLNYLARQQQRLAVTQLNTRLNDGIHTLTLDTLWVSLPDSSVQLKNLALTAPEMSYQQQLETLEKAGKNQILGLYLPEAKVEQINWHDLLVNRQMQFHSLHARQPKMEWWNYPFLKSKSPLKDEPKGLSYELLQPYLKRLAYDTLSVTRADVAWHNYQPDSVTHEQFQDVSLAVQAFALDSTPSDQFLFAQDIELRLPNIRRKLPNSFYTAVVEEVGLSTGKNKLWLTEPQLLPDTHRYAQARQLDYQAAVLNVKGNAFTFQGIDWPRLLSKQEVYVQKALADSLLILAYKDKTLPHDSSNMQPVVHDLFAIAQPWFWLDTIQLKNSYVLYEQLMPDNPQKARIEVTQLNALGRNLTNDSVFKDNNKHFRIQTDLLIEDEGHLEAFFRFPSGATNGAYTYAGTMDSMDLTVINPMIEPLAFVTINEGQVVQGRFFVEANNQLARGKMRLAYNDLRIAFLNKETGKAEGTKEELTTAVANAVLRSNNPKRKWFPLKQGHVYFRREPSLPVFHYWVQSLLSGIKSTFGFDSKELKKELKKQKRAAKRQKRLKLNDKATDPSQDQVDMIKDRFDVNDD